MVNLLFIEDDDAARQARRRADALRPGLRHRRDAVRRRGPPARAQPRGPARGLRAGAERRDLRHLPLRHDAQGPGRRRTSRFGNSLHRGRRTQARRFDYMLANPPFGVEWKKVEDEIEDEHEQLGFAGRFGAGLPRDQRRLVPVPAAHDLEDEAGRGRAARGSPSSSTARRCSPAAPARASREIRRWIIENDWLEAIVALPDQLFYNTGISTYFWIVTNRKRPERRGKVAARRRPRVCARRCARASATSARRSPPTQIDEITRLYPTPLDRERRRAGQVFPNDASATSGSPSSAPSVAKTASPSGTAGESSPTPTCVRT